MWEDDLQLYHLLFIKLVLNETKKKYESLWDLLFRGKHVLRSGQMGCVYQKVIRKSKDRVNEKYNSYSAPSHYLYQCWLIVIWTLGKNFREILIEIWTFSLKTCIWNRRQEIGGHVVSASTCWRDETYSIQQLPRKTARILSFDSTRNPGIPMLVRRHLCIETGPGDAAKSGLSDNRGYPRPGYDFTVVNA